MLQLLHIENIAVIEKSEIEFECGLNVLTGETGAGKSIVIDALSAVIGGRTSRDLIRTGADSALVTAVFTSGGVLDWCAENGIEPDGEGKLFLMRKISADGKNICRINGGPVSVSQLKELGSLLLDIHGQNDGRKLLNEDCHRDYLDSFGNYPDALSEYKKSYDALKATRKEIETLTFDEGEKERRVDQLKFQITEIQRAELVPGEFAEKTNRRDLLKNAVKLTETVSAAFSALYGGDDSDGAIARISEAESNLSSAVRYAESLRFVAEKVTNLRYVVQDVSEEILDFKNSLDFSPEELDELEMRIEVLKRLMRKYGDSEELVLSHFAQCKLELDNIEYSADKIEKLQKELEKRTKTAKDWAHNLSEKRKSAAKLLEKNIMAELNQLNMAGVRFEVEFETVTNEVGLDATGCDKIRFLMSANAGEEPGRISSIASGGELSRIMLAMKNVLAENDDIGTMVFDEVDTGVSGIAAQRVGEKLCYLARNRQILCVTHLPQIAVMADTHYSIEKREQDGRTYTYVNRLDVEGQKREIARLNGGENITSTTLASAGEQLEGAARYKSIHK